MKAKQSKFLSFLVSFSLLLPTVFGASVSQSLQKGFGYFGDFYNALTNGNNDIINGIAILFFVFGLFLIFLNLTRFAFKGERSKSARKGASAILSILVTGSLVQLTDNFVGYYGSILVFLLVTGAAVGAYLAFLKWLRKETGDKKVLFYTFAVLGLIIIDLTLSSLVAKIFEKSDVGTPAVITFIVKNLGEILSILVPLALIIIFLLWIFGGFNKMKDLDFSSSSSEKTENQKEKEKKKKETEDIRNLLSAVQKEFREFNKEYKERTELLKQIRNDLASSRASANSNNTNSTGEVRP